jgi:DDE domain
VASQGNPGTWMRRTGTRSWEVGLSVAGHRCRWPPGGCTAERQTGYGSRPAIFPRKPSPLSAMLAARVTTDGHPSSPRAGRETLGHDVQHRTNKYLNNRLEPDHRGSKQSYDPLHGLGSFHSAARFWCAIDEWRTSLRPRSTTGERPSRSEQRRVLLDRLESFKASMQLTL